MTSGFLSRSSLTVVLVAVVSSYSANSALAQFRTVTLDQTAAPGTAFDFESFDSSPVISSQGHTAFLASLSDGLTFGFFSEGSGALANVILTGDAAPGTGFNFDSIPFGGPLLMNSSGDVMFSALLSDGSTESIWSDRTGVTKIGADGDSAPGTAVSREFNGFLYNSFNSTGQTAFRSSMPPGPAPGNFPSSGIFVGEPGNLSLVAEIGDSAPGTTSAFFSLFATPVLNDNGQVAFSAESNGGGGEDGIWSTASGSLAEVAVSGQSAPGGGTLSIQFRNEVAINDAGDVAFKNTILGGADDGIFVARNGGLEQVAREGLTAPGSGSTFASTNGFGSGELLLDDDGFATFRALLTDGRTGIWQETSGGLGSVVLTSDLAPGGGGASFDGVQEFAVNSNGMVAFEAGLDSFESGIWLLDQNGLLNKLVMTGDLIEVAPGDFRTVEFLDFQGESMTSMSSGLNDLGQVAFYAEFDDGSSGIFVSNATIPEPTTGILLSVLSIGLLARRRKRRV